MNTEEFSRFCERIELNAAVRERVIPLAAEYDGAFVLGVRDEMQDRSRWEEIQKKLCGVVGEDPDRMRMMAIHLSVALADHELYAEKGISDEVWIATMKCFSRFVNEAKVTSHGKDIFDRENWTPHQLGLTLFRVGCLEFEIKRDREPWGTNLHIPSDADLSPEECRRTFREGKKFLERFFPEYAGALPRLHTWLLSPDLRDLLPAGSNLIRFGEMFEIEEAAAGGDWWYRFVFPGCDPTKPAELSEQTSLQRNLKRFLLDGRTFRLAGGHLKDEYWN